MRPERKIERIGRGKRAAFAFLAALSLVIAAHGTAAAQPRIRDIRIEPAILELGPGESRNLTALAVYDDDTTQDVTTQVVFESRDEDVIEISGRSARAVGSGETTIRAYHAPSGEDASEPAEATVFELASLTIQPAISNVQVGATVQLRALGTLENGRGGLDVTSIVEWESSKRGVASVDGGLVRGLSVGEAEISVEDPSSGVKSPKNAGIVHVQPSGGGDPGAEINRIWAEPEELALLTGDLSDLHVMAELEDGGTVDVTAEVSYESTRPQVASVNGTGRVKAEAPGTTRIRIEHPSGVEVDREPEVWVGELEQIHLSPATRNLAVGGTLALKALGSFDNGRSLDLTEQVAWSSDDGDVATVSNAQGTRGRLTGIASGTAVVTARHRDFGVESRGSDGEFTVGSGGPSQPPGEDEEIRDLVFEPPVLRLRPGESKSFKVLAILENGGTRDVSDRVVLTVRDGKVAKVEDGTEIIALAGGHTEVLANDPESRVRARVRGRVEVTRLIALRIEPAQASLAPGATVQLRARADFDDGSTGVDVTDHVSWESGKPNVATVNDTSSRGLVAAQTRGIAEIHAEDLNSGIKSDRSTGRVVVGDAVVAPSTDIVQLAFEPSLLVLARGQTATVAIFGVRADGTRIALAPSDVRLRSQERRVVTVDRDGGILGRRGGVGEVSAEHEESGVTGLLSVTVREVSAVEIQPASVTLRVGATADLTAFARFNDGSDAAPLTGDVSWRSDATNIASVEEIGGKGRITAIEPGIAFIQARHGPSRIRSDAASGQVQVVDELIRIAVEPTNIVLERGETQQFRAIGQFAEGGIIDLSKDVVWDVSNRTVARISATGKVTALANGQVSVIAIDVLTARSSTQDGGDAHVTVGASLTGLKISADEDISTAPTLVRLMPGEATRLYGLGVIQGQTNAVNISARLDWESSNPLIVTVEPGGLVTCAAEGTAIVSATDPDTNITSTGTLGDATVDCASEVGVLQVEPNEGAVDFPKTRQMRAYRVFADGAKVEVTRSVQWTSSNPNVLSIVQSGGDAGVATAIDDGVVTVTAVDPNFGISSNDPGGINGTITVRKTRTELEIFPIFPLPDPDGIHRGNVGEIVRLRARVTYASGATQGVNLRVEWTSSKPEVVLMGTAAGLEINQGLMVAPGQTTIQARWPADETSPELTDTIEVQVR